MSEDVRAITDAEFETEVSQASLPVLVYFWATWCGPCRLTTPLIKSTATTYSDRLKVVTMEVDPNPVTVKNYEVAGVPAFRLIQGDKLLASVEGVINKDKLLNLLDTHLK